MKVIRELIFHLRGECLLADEDLLFLVRAGFLLEEEVDEEADEQPWEAPEPDCGLEEHQEQLEGLRRRRGKPGWAVGRSRRRGWNGWQVGQLRRARSMARR